MGPPPRTARRHSQPTTWPGFRGASPRDNLISRGVPERNGDKQLGLRHRLDSLSDVDEPLATKVVDFFFSEHHDRSIETVVIPGATFWYLCRENRPSEWLVKGCSLFYEQIAPTCLCDVRSRN
jgi:hypothetical protein